MSQVGKQRGVGVAKEKDGMMALTIRSISKKLHGSSLPTASRTGGMAGVIDGINAMSMYQGGRMSIVDPRASVGGRMNAGSMSSQRRSSAYIGRPSNMGVAGLGAIAITKDPRPIREKAWQTNAIRTLIGFLVQAGYNQTLSTKQLQAPSGKDFQSIFKFLYAQLDPKYLFGQKKFEEEVPIILRGLSHNDFDDIPDAELAAEKVFFEYLTKTYAVFLAGDDNYDTMDRELIANFDRKNEKIVKEVEKLNTEHEILSREWANLRDSESPLVIAERENQTLHSDIEKFKQYILHLETKKEKIGEQVKSLEEELASKESELAKISNEKADLQRTVDLQEISPADVDRMTAEREQLVRSLESLAAKTDEFQRAIWEKEISLQKKMDQLEKHVQEYNAFAYRLGLERSDISQHEMQYSIDFNAGSISPENDLNERLKSKVKPVLLRLRADYNSSLHASQDELIALQETLDSLTESLSEKNEELQQIESRITKFTSQYNDEKNIAMEANSISSSEVENLEKELQRLKLELATTLTASQQRLQKASMEYEQLFRKYQESRSTLLSCVFRTFEDTIAFREHIADSLSELQEFVALEMNASKTSILQ
ncbi:kinetochore-associated Ndc80 complex subunit ndc80 [Phlyctochytrium planicorne]|nr:kinetochore-associated Ndc80 complex subunit ndc80 [Phlyctochytrium planicorne]